MSERIHEKYIQRTFELANHGLGTTSPNPLVGAVIVHEDRIIGEGFHQHSGSPHAEIVALENVEDKSLLKESILYVNLEPCAHHGLTPPCTTAIINAGIAKVVVSNKDPNPKVKESESILTEAGVCVTYGVLEQEGAHINRRFFKRLHENRPWVILKWAQTPDGFMDVDRSKSEPGVAWITNERTKILTHQWRAQEDAILIGVNSVINDDPELTAREFQGKQPLRIVIDPQLRCPSNRKVFDNSAPTVVVNTIRENLEVNNPLWIVDKQKPIIPQVLSRLGKLGVNSLIIEGGRKTLQNFIDHGLWDEARILTGIMPIDGHDRAPEIKGSLWESFEYGPDQIEIFGKR